MQHLVTDGMGVLMFDYRGYGASSGRPSERNMNQDALTAYRWLRAQDVGAQRIIVVGQSLGNESATALAAQQPVGGLLLVSPFTRLPDALAERLPWLRLKLVPWTRNVFNVEANFVRFRGPAMLVASKDDVLVPVANSLRLRAKRPDVQWLDATTLRHDGMLQAFAEDGRLGKAIHTLLRYNASVSRSVNP